MFNLSSEHRFAAYYAALFGSIGSIGPFMALWLHHAGVSASMTGIIVAAPSVLMLLTTIRLGRWADGLADRRSAIIAGNWVILCMQLLLFVHTAWWMVLLVWSVGGIVMYAKIPVTDAAALSLSKRRGSDFARIRAFGSIGFIVALTIAGYVYERWGIGLFLFLMLAGNVLRLRLAYALPVIPRSNSNDDKSSAAGQGRDSIESSVEPLSESLLIPVPDPPTDSKTGSLYKPGILLTLAGAAMINASHAMFNTFGILSWTQDGLSEFVSSLAVAAGVAAEVFLMWRFKSLTEGVSARSCLIAAAACGVLRWAVLASNPTLPLLFAAQLLHGVTFGVMYLATASFIARRVDEADAAQGQGLSATMATACMASATFFAGSLFDQWGTDLYWAMAVACIIGAGLLSSSYLFSFDE